MPGTKLIIPVGAQAQPAAGQLVRYRVRRERHAGDRRRRVRRDRRGVEEVESSSRRPGSRGMRLRIYPGGLTPPPASSPESRFQTGFRGGVARCAPGSRFGRARSRYAHVQNGETLYSIARGYQTTVDALRQGNQLSLQPAAPGWRHADHPAGPIVQRSAFFQPLVLDLALFPLFA